VSAETVVTGTHPTHLIDPVTVEIIQGTLASVEMEVETAIARTSRSPMSVTRTTSVPASTTAGCAS